MNSKVILFSNVKGGVGKTTLCALFANYLVQKNKRVIAIDADLQMSLFFHREDEIDDATEFKYKIISLDTSDIDKVKKTMEAAKKMQNYTVLIDCPGTLNDNGLLPILQSADAIIIPISYDHDTLRATSLFIKTTKQLQLSAKLLFVPNKIVINEGTAEEREQQRRNAKVLEKYGTLTPRIKQGVAVKRYSTLSIDKYQIMAVEYAFEKIIEIIK